MSTSVRAISDLHGHLPAVADIEPCDLLLVAGDVCPDHPIGKHERYSMIDNGASYQLAWLDSDFKPWLEEIAARGTVVAGIAGNHDFVFEMYPRDVVELALEWYYLRDSELVYNGLRIWGTPWVPGLPRWAFYGSDTALQARAESIPGRLDILMTHGPPHRVGDLTAPKFGSMNAGDRWLNGAITQKRPKAVVCGHIHEGFGKHDLDGVPVYNVAYLDESYKVTPSRVTTLIDL